MIFVPLIDGFADRENMTIHEPESGDWAPYDSTFDGLYKPRWDGGRWKEGATQEEIEAMKPEPEPPQPSRLDELQNQVDELTLLLGDVLLGGDPL